MPNVTLSREGLAIDGEPLFLLSGCLHYFRYPRGEWAYQLDLAQWAGLNTIDFVIPWNRHEPRPGAYDFAEEADIAAFIDLCHERGLYVIVRPGPYICAEWENGGIPAWLTAQEGVKLRVDDPRYLDGLLRWFDVLMPILAPRQITRGGPIVLCQIENEHWASGVYGHDRHQRTLAEAALARGIDVPQYTCMGATPEWVEFRNGWSGMAEKLQQSRALWPQNPMIVSELWSGWFDSWGAKRNTHKTAEKLDVTLHQLTAVGASGFSHWMWAGGTNFGYWGGRTVGGDNVFMTTSYDYDAPIGEFGELRPKAHIARRHHLFLRSLGAHLAPILADAVPGGPKVIGPPVVKGRSDGGGSVYRSVRAAPTAPTRWRDFTATYLHNPTAEGITFQVFHKQPAAHLVVEVEPQSIRPIFANLPLSDALTLRTHTGRVLCFAPEHGGDTLVLYGRPGETGSLELGLTTGSWQRPVELPDAVTALELDGDALRLRYWLTSDRPRLTLHTGSRPLTIQLLSDEDLASYVAPGGRALPAMAAEPSPSPRIELSTVCHPIVEASSSEGWQQLETPQAMERLGHDYGYGWYRAELDLAAPLETTLLAPAMGDRATVLVNGEPAGTFGVDPAGTSFALPLRLPAGRHELRLLLDNLGRFNYGAALGESKGLWDGLYVGAEHDLSRGWTALWQEAMFAGEAIAGAHPAAVRPDQADVDLGSFAFEGPSVWLLRSFEARAGQRYILYVNGDRNPGALFVNGQSVERFSRHKSGSLINRDVTALVRPGENVVALNIQNYAGLPWRASLLEYDPARPLPARWSFCPGLSPAAAGPVAHGAPALFRTVFPRIAGERLRLRVRGAQKGQIWLNGRNVGRYWNIGPQEHYKLPASWQRDENELLVLAEQAIGPVTAEIVG